MAAFCKGNVTELMFFKMSGLSEIDKLTLKMSANNMNCFFENCAKFFI